MSFAVSSPPTDSAGPGLSSSVGPIRVKLLDFNLPATAFPRQGGFQPTPAAVTQLSPAAPVQVPRLHPPQACSLGLGGLLVSQTRAILSCVSPGPPPPVTLSALGLPSQCLVLLGG